MSIGPNNKVCILLHDNPLNFEGEAGEAITPGMIVELEADEGDDIYEKAIKPHKIQAVVRTNNTVGPAEADIGTKAMDIDWASGSRMHLVAPQPGDKIRFLHINATDVAKGDLLEIDAANAGCVTKRSSGVAVATAMEAKTSNTLGRLIGRVL